jgi:hypothetical protein
MAETIELGGRRFRVIDFDRRTVLADHYLMRMMRATGADRVLPVDGESNESYIVRLQTCLIDSGMAHQLIAGLLMPEGKEEADFTPEMAAETAKHIAGCNTQADRELVVELSMQAVFGFFRQGLDWLERSRNSTQPGANGSASPGTSPALH